MFLGRPPQRASGACGLLATLAISVVLVQVHGQAQAHDDVPAEMAAAATRFLQSLDDSQRDKVAIAFDQERRHAWHYVPSSMMEAHGGRRGLAVKEMSPHQRVLAHGLLSTALSHRGYLQAMTIMALEAVLRDLEGGNPARDPEMYHVAVYGTPLTTGTWGWSFEGHHLSVNLTLIDGQRFSVTPSFFGSNPAIVPGGSQQGLEVLAAEQQLARELMQSLSPSQQKLAVIAQEAPSEIITGADRHVRRDRFEPPQGIPFEQLTADQQALLLKLVAQFATKYRDPIIGQIEQHTPVTTGQDMHFAWAGGWEPHQGHYYRIQTAQFLFEYDNTQNNANHVHAVWRQFDGDFGADLLRQHYESSPHPQP
ncbi:MAG: DUF3500 domain-containing protein [Pirellulaceae bacterium]